jgi:caffeoyl-CoA O-methyltransferase
MRDAQAGYFKDSLNERMDRYLLDCLPPRDPLLWRMEEHAIARGFPFIGPLAGELLEILARSTGARRVFELGSGFGFSAMHFARVLPEGGKVYCTDGDPENEKQARQFFHEAGLAHKLEFQVGDALDILDRTEGMFDLILMDIDKEQYPAGFRRSWPRLRVGGLFIADNLLWHGRVLGDDNQPSTNGIREFTGLLYATPGARTSILPLRDGLSITLKTA